MVRKEVDQISATIDRLTFDVAAKTKAPAIPAEPFADLVVATDGSKASRHALAWGKRLVEVQDSHVTLVRAVEPPGLTTAFLDPSYDRKTDEAEAKAGLKDAAAQFGPDVETKLLKGYAVATLTRLTEEGEYDAILLGSHGYGKAKRAVLGSVADGVKNHVPCHVLIARTAPKGGPILAAVDGSAASKYAAKIAIHLADALDVDCTILSVVKKAAGTAVAARIKSVEDILPKQDLEKWKDRRVNLDVLAGDPAARILEAAKREKSDLIVVGGRGLGGLKSLVPGGVSNKVAHRATTSVLVAKAPTR